MSHSPKKKQTKTSKQAKVGSCSFRKRLKLLLKVRPDGVEGLTTLHLELLKKGNNLKNELVSKIKPPTQVKIKRDCIADLVNLIHRPKKSIQRGLATYFRVSFGLYNISNYSREWLVFGPKTEQPKRKRMQKKGLGTNFQKNKPLAKKLTKLKRAQSFSLTQTNLKLKTQKKSLLDQEQEQEQEKEQDQEQEQKQKQEKEKGSSLKKGRNQKKHSLKYDRIKIKKQKSESNIWRSNSFERKRKKKPTSNEKILPSKYKRKRIVLSRRHSLLQLSTNTVSKNENENENVDVNKDNLYHYSNSNEEGEGKNDQFEKEKFEFENNNDHPYDLNIDKNEKNLPQRQSSLELIETTTSIPDFHWYPTYYHESMDLDLGCLGDEFVIKKKKPSLLDNVDLNYLQNDQEQCYWFDTDIQNENETLRWFN